MQHIVLKHLSGSKTQQVEAFPLSSFSELVIGRDPLAAIRYDPTADHMVSRQHAKIVRDAMNPAQFMICDLNSSNGTYVNHQRIAGAARITPGDFVQLGPGGPGFEFDLEPRPATADFLPATQMVNVVQPPQQQLPSTTVLPSAGNLVGRHGAGLNNTPAFGGAGETATNKSVWHTVGLFAAIIMLLCFFLPWVEMGVSFIKTGMSGWQIAMGSGPAGLKTPSWPLLLLVPLSAVIVAALLGGAMLSKGPGAQEPRLSSFALIIGGVLSALLMMYQYFDLNAQFNQNILGALAQTLVSHTFGWGASLAGGLAMLGCGLLDLRDRRSKPREFTASPGSWMQRQ
jgi:pSer/pThr/pTyr-binding forkhead associated (FHA) protein